MLPIIDFDLFYLSSSFPSKVVLGRTHIKDVAAKRKVELNSYIQSLMNASTDVSEVIFTKYMYSIFWIIFETVDF